MSRLHSEPRPAYAYHVMRCAAERFARDVSALDESELALAREQAFRTYALETLVFESEEAKRVEVAPQRIDEAVATIVSRYSSRKAFASGLESNRLTEQQLREALHREILFDGVMERVAEDTPVVTSSDALRYYEDHQDRFVVPERRRARHILVTINEAISENRRAAARQRIEQLAEVLASEPSRFAEYARRHSECPSALDGGSLGEVTRGRLYPALDAVLFQMAPGTVSGVVETEVGYHLLLLESCVPEQVIPFSSAEGRIRRTLFARRKRQRQEAFLARLSNKRLLEG